MQWAVKANWKNQIDGDYKKMKTDKNEKYVDIFDIIRYDNII